MKRLLQVFFFVLCVCGVTAQNSVPEVAYVGSAVFTFYYTGPGTITVDENCVGILDWGHPNTPTVEYDGPGELIFFDIISISGNYEIGDEVPVGESVTVIYLAEDDQGNSAQFNFTIDFKDRTPPVFDEEFIQWSIVVNCLTDIPGEDEIVVWDNCDHSGESVTIEISGEIPTDTCGAATFNRTLTATDVAGNSTSRTQRIFVLPDTTAPIITAYPEDGESPCDKLSFQYPTWLDRQESRFIAMDEGCGGISYYNNAPELSELADTCGPILITFTAEDLCGNKTSTDVTFTIVDEVSPNILKQAEDLLVDCSSPDAKQQIQDWLNNQGGAIAEDECTAVTWSYSPDTIDFAQACNIPLQIQFIASDMCNNKTFITATLEIQDTTPPIITDQSPLQVVECSGTDMIPDFKEFLNQGSGVEVEDYCSPFYAYTFKYVINDTILTETDLLDSLNASIGGECSSIVIDGDEYEKVIGSLTYQVEISDACGNSVLSDSIYYIVIDTEAPVIVQSPRDTAFGCVNLSTIIDDFNVWYNTAGDAAVYDNCGDVTIASTPSYDSLVSLLTLGNFSCSEGIDVQFQFVDNCGNVTVDSSVATVTIVDTLPPEIVAPPIDTVVDCSGNLDTVLHDWIYNYASANVVDGCSDAEWLYFKYIDNSGEIVQLGFDELHYPEMKPRACRDSLDVTFVFGDFCNNIDSFGATFYVIDTVAPELVNFRDSLAVDCAEIPEADDLEFIQSCPSQLSIEVVDSLIRGGDSTDCAFYNFTIKRIYYVSDNCEYFDTLYQTIEVSDNTAPEFTVPDSITVECGEEDNLEITGTPENVLDACGSPVEITYSDSIAIAGCPQTIIRKWMATDACMNSRVGYQTIEVVDTQAPSYITELEDKLVQCLDGIESQFALWIETELHKDAEDNCGLEGRFAAFPDSYEINDSTSFPDSIPVWKDRFICSSVRGDTIASVDIDFVLYDACLNADITTKTFHLIDTIAPVIDNCPSSDTTFAEADQCLAFYEVPAISYRDACADHALTAYLIVNKDTLNYEEVVSEDFELTLGTHDFKLEVIDCAMNRTACEWTVEVIDTIAPAINCAFDSIYILDRTDCYQPIVLDNYEISENCTLDSVVNQYVIYTADGDTITGTLPDDEHLVLGTGVHIVDFTAVDAAGNSSTCQSIIEVKDTIPPEAVCRPAFISVFPDGQNALIEAEDFNLNSSDNCGIDTMWISPDNFNCEDAGTAVNVTFYVRDKSGLIDSCETTGQIEMALFNPSYELDLCAPDTLRLFANPPGGDTTQYHYSWTGPNGYASNVRNPIITGVNSSYSGTYTVTIKGPTGCLIEGSTTVNIDVMAEPLLTVSADTICRGESIILESNNYSGSVTYNWYEGVPPNGVLLGTSYVPAYNLEPILGLHTYYVVVSNNECETDPSKTIKVNVVEIPVAEVERAYIELCEGEALSLNSLNSDPAVSYLWQGPQGFISTEKSPLVATHVTIEQAGIYTLQVAMGTCTSLHVEVEVEVIPIPEKPLIAGDTIVCVGEELRLQTTGDFDSYIWENSQGQSHETEMPILIIPSTDENDKGEWTVKVNDGTCSSLPSTSIYVDVKPLPEFELVAPDVICEEDSVYLSANSQDELDYVWISPLDDTLTGNSVVFDGVGGQYTLIATTEYGCEASENIQIDLVPKPTVTALSSTAPLCVDSLVEVTFEPTVFPPDINGIYTYSWFYEDDLVGVDSILFMQDVTIQDTGMYYLVVEVGSCASDTFGYHLEMGQVPPVPAILSDTEFCAGDSVVIEVEDVGATGLEYIFYTEEFGLVTIDSPRWVLGVINDDGAIPVNLRVQDGECYSELLFSITINETPGQNTISGTETLCEGEDLDLAASGTQGEFIWYFNGDSLTTTSDRFLAIPSATTQNTGSYTVKESLGRCASPMSDTFHVEVNETPLRPEIASFMDGICVSEDSAAIEVCISSGTYNEDATYKWYLVDNQEFIGESVGERCHELQNLNELGDGENPIYVTAEIGGCFAAENDTINSFVSRAPEETADAGRDIYACSGDFPTLHASEPVESVGEWQILTDTTRITSFTDPEAQLTQMRLGENILVWTLSHGACENFSTDTVVVYYDVPPVALDDDYVRPFGSSFNMDILENDVIIGGVEISILEDVKNGRTNVGSSTIRYTPFNGFVGQDSLIYRICSASCPDACSEAIVTIQIGDETLCDIPTIFTPNGDGTNDFFTIQCLSSDDYPNNSLKIFNQYGDQVFSAAPYKNDWRGTYKGGDLPVGTYYYLMNFGDGREVEKGFVVIER